MIELFVVTDVCENPNVLRVVSIFQSILMILYYLVPVGLILMITIDIAKNVIASDSEIGKNTGMIVKRLISAMIFFLLPTIINFALNLVITSSDSIDESIISCVENTSNIEHFEKKYAKLKQEEDERIKQEMEDNKYVLQVQNRQSKATVSSKSASSEGTTNGQSYNLDKDTIKSLAAKAVGEQGNEVAGAAAEVSLMANLYELKGSNYSSVYDYVVNGGWFGPPERVKAAMASNTPSQEVIDAVKDVLVNGNRTLPLYVDEHDCWDCNSSNICSSGIKGDICSLTTDGTTTTSLSNIKNRSSYIKDKTLINNVYGAKYTFYTFPTESSDPFGYTQDSYNKIQGNG